jgi:[ribosomal protein S5]-alanine N-acetyltransferase
MPVFGPAVLDTERLRLRWIEDDDAPGVLAMRADPQVMRYATSAPWTDIAQANESIARAREARLAGTAVRFTIELKDCPGLIGDCTLFDFHEMNRRAEIGYMLIREHWGRGYMNEALCALLVYAFETLDLNRIEADVDPRNTASIKSLERMGFKREGTMRERWIVNGEVCDTAFFGLLHSEWKTL